ncbi:DUF3084 domain-containing protein [Synechococcus lacustris Tous-12m]
MTGWLLILAVLLLGGVLATIGDRLGSRIGKARLSLFQLRPRSTAVLITVFTGSLISALTLGLMLAVSEQLRVGLFQLDQLETKLRNSRRNLQFSVEQLSNSQKQLAQARQEGTKADQGRLAARRQLQQVEVRANQLRSELAPCKPVGVN